MYTSDSPLLGSWRQIAAYLGNGVRTVQRWERDLSLPVRRPVPNNQRVVVAVPAELDAWVQQQVPRTPIVKADPLPTDVLRFRLARLIELRTELIRSREVTSRLRIRHNQLLEEAYRTVTKG